MKTLRSTCDVGIHCVRQGESNMRFTVPKNQSGITLVEILIAVTLSLVLLGGVLQLFQSAKKTYLLSEEVARLQEDSRFALELLARDVRMIGYQGCADPENIELNIIANNAPSADFSQSELRAAEILPTGWNPALPGEITNTVTDEYGNNYTITDIALSSSDVLFSQYASPVGAQLTGNTTPDNANIQIDENPGGFAAGDLMVISDCDTADMFRATSVSDSAGMITIAHTQGAGNNSSNNLSKSYPPNTQVLRFNSSMYFVAVSRDANGNVRANKRGDPIYSLYKTDIDNNLIELIRGVDNMQLQFGEELTNGNIRYMEANDAGLDMRRVKSVKIGLLMSTIEAVTDSDDATDYNVAGVLVRPEGTEGAVATYPNDRRLRRAFTSTVNLRNRL
jgi:type IV pilus assembly protein PilW